MSADESSSSTEADDTATAHREERRGGQRVIVVNSQPGSGETELPPRRMRSLGAVSSHASDPVSGDTRRRRRSSDSLIAVVVAAAPVLLAAFGITFLTDRTTVLAATAALVVVWLGGLVLAWRNLGPGGAKGRGGVWFGRAVGLVLGAVGAVYLLLDTVRPLL